MAAKSRIVLSNGKNEMNQKQNRKELKMKKFNAFLIIATAIALFTNTALAIENNPNSINSQEMVSGVDLMPTIREHRAYLEATGEDSITTVINETESSNGEIVLRASLTTLRDGTNWEGSVDIEMKYNYPGNYWFDDWYIYIYQSHPGNPEDDEESSLSLSSHNLDEADIYWRGDDIYDSDGDEIEAEYPLASGYSASISSPSLS